jgi:hypothetical protein
MQEPVIYLALAASAKTARNQKVEDIKITLKR